MIRNENIENQIKEYFSKFKQIQRPCVEKYLNEHKNIIDYLNQILNDTPEWLLIINIIQGILKNFDLETCKICGKKIKYHRSILFGKTQTYCSKKCSMNDPEVFKKVVFKSKETMLKKYGVEHQSQLKEVQEKIKKTCLKKYGVKHSSQLKEIKEKTKNTCLKKYGGNAPASSKIIQEKIKNTCIERYGVDNSAKLKVVQEKIKNTFIERYGINSIFKSEKIKQLNAKIQLEKGYQTILKWKNYVIPLFTLAEYKGGKNNVYKWKCIKCGNEFEQKIYTTNFNKEFSLLPRCLSCYPFGGNYSFEELELLEFCKQFFPNAEKNKTLISPLELDIVIPEIKLALEFNGLYYHSINGKRQITMGYHLNKVLKCNEKGYRLIHIWEDEWINNKTLIQQKLINIFNKNEIINFNKKLDRSWFNNLTGNFIELPPEIINRNGYKVENCGYLISEQIYQSQQQTNQSASNNQTGPIDAEVVQ